MSTLDIVGWLIIVLIGIGGSAVCSGLEVGLYSVNRVLVQVRAAGGGAQSRHARLLEKQILDAHTTLTALLVWNNIFNYTGTLAMTTLIAAAGFGEIQIMLLQIVILTPVLLIFAESTPKEVFRSHSAFLMERFVYVTWFMRTVFIWIPVVPTVLFIARLASKIVGVDASGSLDNARHRVAELIKFGSPQMSDTQVTLIDRALELENATVRLEMIPLRSVITVRSEWSIPKAKAFIRNHSYARYPVLSVKGRVVGILKGIDLYMVDDSKAQTVGDLMSEPTRLEGEMSVSAGLTALSQSGARLGIVVLEERDIGVITRKDLIEPLVGELDAW